MSGSFVHVNGEDLDVVDQLSFGSLYSRYLGGSGQGLAVNISDLRENLSLDEIPTLGSRLGSENLSVGTHEVSYQDIAAVFRDEEQSTIGGFRADVTLNVQVDQNGRITVVGGTWSHSSLTPTDLYNFDPIWSPHRSLGANLATAGQHVFDFFWPNPNQSMPFNIAIVGSRDIEIIGNGLFDPSPECFLPDTPIQMWPLDPSIKPLADGIYDEQLVLSNTSDKPISAIKAGDLVLAYDANGRLQPGRVAQTFVNQATHILDFWGTGVTPGHAYLCADGIFEGQHVPLMDILRTDGAIMHYDGTKIRAATGLPLDHMGDRMVHANASQKRDDGSWTEEKPGQIRLGTRVILEDGRDLSVLEIIRAHGWDVTEDGYVCAQTTGDDGAPRTVEFLFPWTFSENLPGPEDYILARSNVSLAEIYAAGEWEAIGTRLSAPKELPAMRAPQPNIPPAFANHPDAPTKHNRVKQM